jgi:hypothetical protein
MCAGKKNLFSQVGTQRLLCRGGDMTRDIWIGEQVSGSSFLVVLSRIPPAANSRARGARRLRLRLLRLHGPVWRHGGRHEELPGCHRRTVGDRSAGGHRGQCVRGRRQWTCSDHYYYCYDGIAVFFTFRRKRKKRRIIVLADVTEWI